MAFVNPVCVEIAANVVFATGYQDRAAARHLWGQALGTELVVVLPCKATEIVRCRDGAAGTGVHVGSASLGVQLGEDFERLAPILSLADDFDVRFGF